MTPVWIVTVDGNPMGGMDRLLRVSVTDADGLESDACELEFDDADNALALPRKGAIISIALGFLEQGGPVPMGLFTVDRIEGGNDGGWTMTVIGRAADLKAGLKEQRRKSWKDGETVKGVFQAIAKRNGLTAKVTGEVAGKKLPRDLAIQNNESDLSYATRIGRRFDCIVKVAGGKLLCVPRGAGGLPALVIVPGMEISIRYGIGDRTAHKAVEAQWRDRKANRTVTVSEASGEDGPVMRLPTTYPDEEGAKAAAKARARELKRAGLSVSVSLPGMPAAAAEADVIFAGFRAPIGGTLRAVRVTHEMSKGAGYTTSIECEAKAP